MGSKHHGAEKIQMLDLANALDPTPADLKSTEVNVASHTG